LEKKPITKRGLVDWFKVEALNSNPSPRKKKKVHLLSMYLNDGKFEKCKLISTSSN
jgi:hypothetical protein